MTDSEFTEKVSSPKRVSKKVADESEVVDNFILHPATHDADPPAWPHFNCHNGYAWHPDEHRRACFQGDLGVPAELVARVLMGPPIERLIALKQLLKDYKGTFVRIFLAECSACGKNHQRIEGKKWARVAEAIHEGAIAALRAANPARRRVMDVRLIEISPMSNAEVKHIPVPLPLGMSAPPVKPEKHKKKPNPLSGLPYCKGQPAITLQAQLGFARGLMIAKSKPLPKPSSYRPTVPGDFEAPNRGGRPRNDGNPPGWRPPPEPGREN